VVEEGILTSMVVAWGKIEMPLSPKIIFGKRALETPLYDEGDLPNPAPIRFKVAE
jgi:hypothetical protein